MQDVVNKTDPKSAFFNTKNDVVSAYINKKSRDKLNEGSLADKINSY